MQMLVQYPGNMWLSWKIVNINVFNVGLISNPGEKIQIIVKFSLFFGGGGDRGGRTNERPGTDHVT